MVRNYNNKKVSVKQKTVNALPYEIRKVQDTLASRLATRVQIKRDKQGKGEMVISFFSDDDLFRLKELIED